jgi:hypothetical protein
MAGAVYHSETHLEQGFGMALVLGGGGRRECVRELHKHLATPGRCRLVPAPTT